MSDQALAALITGGFSVIVLLLGKLLRDNRRDHGLVMWRLRRIEKKIDGHIEGHGGDAQ